MNTRKLCANPLPKYLEQTKPPMCMPPRNEASKILGAIHVPPTASTTNLCCSFSSIHPRSPRLVALLPHLQNPPVFAFHRASRQFEVPFWEYPRTCPAIYPTLISTTASPLSEESIPLEQLSTTINVLFTFHANV